MTEKIKEILQNRDITIPRILFTNYKKIGLTEKELIFTIYLINSTEIFNPKQISIDMNINLNEVMELISNLKSKGILDIELKKVGTKRNEYILLDNLYEKLTNIIINKEEEKTTNIYDIFEKEFGRTISPMEYQIIGAWLDNGTSEETILLALKEATYNGVSNLRYIDKIISEWNKKGIKTQEDVEKSRINFKQKKEAKPKNDILDYDWLNDK